LSSPTGALDFGNSGTGSRLMMGVVTGHAITATFTGDESLRARPMNRILNPLREMGLKDTAGEDGQFPFTLTGGQGVQGIDYTLPMASAQVKSAVLLAGLRAGGETVVREPVATRDHTERMLKGFGVELEISRTPEMRVVRLKGGQELRAMDTDIPGDPSSAAFLVAAGAISAGGDVLVQGVMSNDTRSGFYDVVSQMGADLGAEERDGACGERMVDLHVTSRSGLVGTKVAPRLVASMIDEFPILAVMAAFADGETVVSGAEELRVKETDRIDAVVDMLRANGVEVEGRPDGFVVQGCAGPVPGGGLVETRHDHRIAMSALVMGTAAEAPVSVDDVSMIETSYPDFLAHMAALGADIREG
jgi:3-phosphoshikimate 1-carboxyvinyltransferase